MPLPTGDVIGILADNLRLRGSVLPISKRNATRWAKGLDLPKGGRTVLYTGMMYQLIPYIEGLVKEEQRLGDSPLSRLTGLARFINRFINVSTFMVWPAAKLRDEYNQVPRDVAQLLRKAGVEFGYLYEDDLYSGALDSRPGRRRGCRRARPQGLRGAQEARGGAGHHHRSSYHQHAALRLPEAHPRLRHRGEDLPRGAAREGTAAAARAVRARSPSTTHASSPDTRTS